MLVRQCESPTARRDGRDRAKKYDHCGDRDVPVEERLVGNEYLRIECPRRADNVKSRDGSRCLEGLETSTRGTHDEERLIDESAKLLDRDDRVDAAAKGREYSKRIEEGVKRLNRSTTFNRYLTEREFIVEGELTETVVQ